MQRTTHILIVGSDTRLKSEFEAALGGVKNTRAVTHYVPDYRHGIEASRSRRPDLICVELEGDIARLKTFAEEVSVSSPESTVVVLYSREAMRSTDDSESVLIEAMRANVRDFLRRPLSSAELSQLLERLSRQPEARNRQVGTIVSFVSNKGGVGKSTLSTNTAAALARRHPNRVLLIDASIQLGVCNFMLNLNPTTSIVDVAREHDRLDETLIRQLAAVHSSGLHLLAAPTDAVEASEIEDETMSRILQLARRSYDFVVVDTFALLDGVVMSILDVTDIIFQVLAGTVPSVVGGYRFRQVLEGLGLPRERLRLVLNQNYPSFTGNLRPSDVNERLSLQLDHVFPYQKKILEAQNAGQPYILGAGRYFGFGKAMARLVDEIEGYRGVTPSAAGTNAPPPAPEPETSKRRKSLSAHDDPLADFDDDFGDDGAAA
ncbi:MAG: AAA family ATPase [Planctomycetota bacterium]